LNKVGGGNERVLGLLDYVQKGEDEKGGEGGLLNQGGGKLVRG